VWGTNCADEKGKPGAGGGAARDKKPSIFLLVPVQGDEMRKTQSKYLWRQI